MPADSTSAAVKVRLTAKRNASRAKWAAIGARNQAEAGQ